jgi:gliding motility-associated-like protein
LIVEPNTVCADTFEQEIRLLPQSLKPDFVFDYESCSDSIIFTAVDQTVDASSRPISWQWLLLPQLDTSSLQNPTFTINKNGFYSLRLQVQSENGCEATIEKEFEVDLPDTVIVCKGDSVALNPNFNPNYQYNWSPVNGLNNNLLANPLASPDSSTLYRVIITEADGFCKIERSVFVKIAKSIDSLIITASQDTIFGSGTVQLAATYDRNFLYTWQPANTLSKTRVFNPVATPTQTTTYQVTVENIEGCERVAFWTIVVINLACEEPNVFIPSAFTPNEDGVNDVFRVRGNNFDQVYLAVYNRWGQRVFESNSLEATWDGTLKGEALPADVYGYYAEIRCFDGSIFVKKGNCTLIR